MAPRGEHSRARPRAARAAVDQAPCDSHYRAIVRQGDPLLVSPEGFEEPLLPPEGALYRVAERSSRCVSRMS